MFNYTGIVLGVDVSQKKIVANFATASGPLVAQTNDLTEGAGGGETGVWQSGMGVSTDGSRLFFVTGNGDAYENGASPASGTSGCRTLAESVVSQVCCARLLSFTIGRPLMLSRSILEYKRTERLLCKIISSHIIIRIWTQEMKILDLQA